MQPGRDILIADAGGTSTRWCLLGTDGYVKRDLHAAPVNVCVLDDRMILAALQAVDVLLESSSAVYFYGAGCATGNECDRVAAAFPRDRVQRGAAYTQRYVRSSACAFR